MEKIITNTTRLAHSIEEASDMTSLSKQFLRLEVKNGRLEAKRCGRRVIILHDDLMKYLRTQSVTVVA